MQFTTLRNVTSNTLRSVTSNKLRNLMHTYHLNKCIIDYSFLCKFYLGDSDFNTFRFHITVVKWYKNGIPITFQTGEVLRNPLILIPFYTI